MTTKAGRTPSCINRDVQTWEIKCYNESLLLTKTTEIS